jgi:ribonuclease D
VLPDRALVSAVTEAPRTVAELTALPVFSGPSNRRRANQWFRAIQRGRAVPDSELPAASVPGNGPPPPRIWKDRDPDAATRLTRARDALAHLSEDLRVPVENLLSPDSLRRLCWRPPAEQDEASLAQSLLDLGARPWQVSLVAPALAEAFAGE